MYNMRITANMSSRNYNKSMQSINSRMDYLYNCILTGQKFMKGSQNPKGANRAIFYNTLLEETATHKDNITTAKGILSTADDLITNTISPVIGGTDGSSSSATGLILSAINGDKSPDEMRAIAADLEQKARALVGSMNQDYGGRKIFGGQNNGGAPFSIIKDKHGNQVLTYNGVDVSQPKKNMAPDGLKVNFSESVKAANATPGGPAKTYNVTINIAGVDHTVSFNGPTQNAAGTTPKTDEEMLAEAQQNFMDATLGVGGPKVDTLFAIKDGKIGWKSGVTQAPNTDFSIKDQDTTASAGQGLGIKEEVKYDYPNKGLYLDFSKASSPSSNPNLPGPPRTVTLTVNGASHTITFPTAALNKQNPDGTYTLRSEKELSEANWESFMKQPLGTGAGDTVGTYFKNDMGYLEAKDPKGVYASFTIESKDERAVGFTTARNSNDYDFGDFEKFPYMFEDAGGNVRGIGKDEEEATLQYKLFPGAGPIYVDVGMGISYDANGRVNPDTALDVSFNGAEMLGCGSTKNGLSKNVIQSMLEAAQVLREGADSGNINEAKGAARAIHDQMIENQKSMMAAHVSVGVRGNAIDFYEAKIEGDKANYQKGLQDAMGLSTMEQAEYITDWKVVNSSYNACLQMGSKVIPPSIFDFMR